MRKLFVLFAIAAMTTLVATSGLRADEAKSEPSQARQTAKDPNYRFHNGQWWYWMPAQKNWKVWNGTSWTDFQGGQRSYSYTEGQPLTENVGQGVTRMFGAPLQRVPDNVSETGQIIGSYGFRRAGSKMTGNY